MRQPQGYHLRRASAQDEEFLFRLYAEHQRSTFALLNLALAQQDFFLSMQYRARNASYAAAHPGAVNDIICNDGDAAPIGRMLTSETEHAIHLIDIALIWACRGRGLGSRILKDLQRESVGKDKKISLHVLQDSPAKGLYLRLGFRVLEQTEIYLKMEWGNSSSPAQESV